MVLGMPGSLLKSGPTVLEELFGSLGTISPFLKSGPDVLEELFGSIWVHSIRFRKADRYGSWSVQSAFQKRTGTVESEPSLNCWRAPKMELSGARMECFEVTLVARQD